MMKNSNSHSYQIFVFLFIAVQLMLSGCGGSTHSEEEKDNIGISHSHPFQSTEIAVSAPPFSEDIFPCSGCHDEEWETNQERRVLDMHEEIVESFNHDSDNRWCLDCHNVDNRDYLKLASGKLVSYEESYKLCGQCHGDKLRDWKVGVHGKRTGEWNGKKEYLLCVHCHNPHSPKFKSLKPLPPPGRQEDIY
jgi:hypothetical protein